MPNHTGYPVNYVIRLRGDVVVQSVCYRAPAAGLSPASKVRINFWPHTLYRSDGAEKVINLVLYWARGHRAALQYLATSLTNPSVKQCGCIASGCSRSSTSRTASNASD